MADETMTTEVADNPQTEVSGDSVLGSGISDNQTATDWKSSLPQELQSDPTLANFKDVESLAKTVVHQQKVLGSRIPIPKNDEEKAELYTKLGRPEEASGYEVQIPETHAQYFEENQVTEFKEVAHKIGLNNEQVNALIDYQVNNIENAAQYQAAELNSGREEAQTTLQKEWGVEYDKNLRAAHRALQVYGNEEVQEAVNGELGNNPAFIKMLANIGSEVTEDMAQNTSNNNVAVSVLDAKAEIESIMQDPSNPYFNAGHKDHRSAVERMRQLHEKVYGK